MATDKSINLAVNNPKVAATVALGVGVIVGVGTAYAINRVQSRSRITEQIAHLHSTILEVKSKLALIEQGLSHHNLDSIQTSIKSKPNKTYKKSVSFCSTTSSSTYKTAKDGYSSDCSTSRGNDTDYYSPDEDDDEFFDLSPSDEEKKDRSLNSQKQFNLEEFTEGIDKASALSQLLRKVDSLLDGSPDNHTAAYDLLLQSLSSYPNNAEVLWRLAKATRFLSVLKDKIGDKSGKEELVIEAHKYAEQALYINDKNANVHKWYAILSGERGEFLGLKERIASGQAFKKHIDIALDLSPNDSTLHHLLGRFCFEVSQLSWIERKAAAALFGEVPSSNFEEALRHFLAADELHQSCWKENCLFVSKCYSSLSDEENERQWLQKAADAPIVTADDEIVEKEIKTQLLKFSS